MSSDDDGPKVYDDVPRTAALVRTRDETHALVRKMAGEEMPDECRFLCVTCGWDKTLRFDEEEIEALGGDVTSYRGSCPECGAMTLTPYAKLMGQDIGNIYAHAKKARLDEYREQAEVQAPMLADAMAKGLRKEVLNVMSGSIFDGPEQEPETDEAADGEMPEFPDANDTDLKVNPR